MFYYGNKYKLKKNNQTIIVVAQFIYWLIVYGLIINIKKRNQTNWA